MKMKLLGLGLALTFGTGYIASAFAQANPAALVKQRQGKMALQGKYFGPLAGMAAGRAPYDAAVVARNAGYLEALGDMAWDAFDPATANEKSNALPEIYKDAAGFKAAQDTLHGAVVKLVAASKAGNEAGVKAAVGDIGKACGTCHDKYRAKM